MVPSSSEDVTRARRGKPKRLFRSNLTGNGGNVILYVLISFHSRDVFYALSHLFVWLSFRLFCARLAVYSVSGSEVNLNDNGDEYTGYVSVRCNSFLYLFAVVYKRSQNNNVKKPHCIFERT